MWNNPTHFNLAYSKDHFTNRFNIASYDRQHVSVSWQIQAYVDRSFETAVPPLTMFVYQLCSLNIQRFCLARFRF